MFINKCLYVYLSDYMSMLKNSEEAEKATAHSEMKQEWIDEEME